MEIEEVEFKIGSAPDSGPLKLRPSAPTLFVGPNNGGKSLALKELRSSLYQESMLFYAPKECVPSDLRRIIKRTSSTLDYPLEEIEAALTLNEHRQWTTSGGLLEDPSTKTAFNYEFLSQLRGPGNQLQIGRHILLRKRTLLLDGTTRLTLLKDTPGGDLKAPAQCVIQALLTNDKQREKWRRQVFDAIGMHPVLDPTNLKQISVSLSGVAPPSSQIERSFTAEAIEFFRGCTPMSAASDGVAAYCGICAALFCSDFDVLFIDEPEAFLHPPLARRLAKLLCQTAHVQGLRIFAATHSPDFVMGCVQSGVPTNVVRLTYDGNSATARLLRSDRLTKLMRDPLLRSTGVLTSLFHQGVVVCEGDADRAFYQEINERLAQADSGGLDSCLFLNCHSWQNVAAIVGPLRELGIPAAAIVDLDVLLTDQIPPLMRACAIPPITADGFSAVRSRLVAQAKQSSVASHEEDKEWKRRVKHEGVLAFGSELAAVAEKLLDDLAEYGIFVVQVGELERWLPHLGAHGHGPQWLIEIFQKMEAGAQDQEYVGVGTGDVWGFVTAVLSWVTNQSRKGIPTSKV